MRQGCISLGKVQCDGCQNIIPYAGRYLMVQEEDGVETETGERHSYCVKCCDDRGYTQYRHSEKSDTVLTFFPAGVLPPPPPEDELPVPAPAAAPAAESEQPPASAK